MTPQQIVGLIVRLFSIWLIFVALQIIGLGHLTIEYFNISNALWSYAIAIAILLVAIFSWYFPMLIAHSLIPKTNHNNVLSMPVRSAAAAGSALFGLWAIISSIAKLVSYACLIFLKHKSSYMPNSIGLEDFQIAELIGVVIKTGVGIFLLAKPWYIAAKIFPAKNNQE